MVNQGRMLRGVGFSKKALLRFAWLRPIKKAIQITSVCGLHATSRIIKTEA